MLHEKKKKGGGGDAHCLAKGGGPSAKEKSFLSRPENAQGTYKRGRPSFMRKRAAPGRGKEAGRR